MIVIDEPALLIRISRSWHDGLSEQELYEVTRGVWKAGERREHIELAFAVGGGVIREVYRVRSWHPAGTTEYLTRTREEIDIDGRWEFVGELAEEPIRQRYMGEDVSGYFTQGSSNPIQYLNVG